MAACQFHALNVEGSNPSPTEFIQMSKLIWWNGRHGGLKIHSFCEGLGSTPRMGKAGMVELGDTMDLGSVSFTLCKFNSCCLYPFMPLSSKGRTPLFLSGNAGSSPTRGEEDVWLSG